MSYVAATKLSDVDDAKQAMRCAPFAKIVKKTPSYERLVLQFCEELTGLSPSEKLTIYYSLTHCTKLMEKTNAQCVQDALKLASSSCSKPPSDKKPEYLEYHKMCVNHFNIFVTHRQNFIEKLMALCDAQQGIKPVKQIAYTQQEVPVSTQQIADVSQQEILAPLAQLPQFVPFPPQLLSQQLLTFQGEFQYPGRLSPEMFAPFSGRTLPPVMSVSHPGSTLLKACPLGTTCQTPNCRDWHNPSARM